MTDTCTASIVQLTTSDLDPSGVLKTAADLIEVAADRGSQLVVLPEVWTGLGYSSVRKPEDIAEPVPGPATDMLAEKARQHGMVIVGSLYARGRGDRLKNVAPVIGPDGEVVAVYEKTHLFDAPARRDLGAPVMESEKVASGDELTVAPTPYGPLGVTICSDLRFPEPYRVLALRGARIIVNCSAFLAPRQDHWEVLLRARAMENQVYVLGSGQYGREPASGMGFVGRSMIVDPWGTVVATASDRVGVVTAQLDLGMIDDVRHEFPLLAQRRPEMYGDLCARVDDHGLLAQTVR